MPQDDVHGRNLACSLLPGTMVMRAPVPGVRL